MKFPSQVVRTRNIPESRTPQLEILQDKKRKAGGAEDLSYENLVVFLDTTRRIHASACE